MQLTDRLHALRIPFRIPVAPGVTLDRFVYCYLLFGRQEVVLVDSGVAGAERTIADYLGRHGRDPRQISRIVQTHAHPDHLGATCALQAATGCGVWCHPAERAWIEDVGQQFRDRPVPGFHDLVGGSARVAGVLNDGDVVALDDGTTTLEILEVPGHSPGSVALWIGSEGALVSGDALLTPGAMPIYDDVARTVRSVRRLQGRPAVRLLLSSWDEPRRQAELPAVFDGCLDYLRTVHRTALAVSAHRAGLDPLALASEVVARLGLPPVAANPLVARSLVSSLRWAEADFDTWVPDPEHR